MKETFYTALVLAAVCGQRVGGYKPLWQIGNRAIIDLVIEVASSACSRTV